MNTNITVRRLLAAILTFCLVVPSTGLTALADGKSGKKSFKEGIKYEQLQQWDLAAQEFALAVAAEPNNAEYRLHYARALANASLMFIKRGDELAKQGDYASAYNAYRQAVGYDQGNEMAQLKMKNMVELQKDQALGLGQLKYDERTGNLKPVSNDVVVASRPRNRDAVVDLKLDQEFKDCIKNMARTLDLNVLFDESVRVPNKVNVELRGVTMAKAFDLILLQNKMSFQQVDRKTIMVFADNPQTRQRFEQAVLKPFYLGNLKITDARQIINTLMPGRQLATLEDQKVILVKGSPSELQLVQDILESVDKNISEVVIDIEIYEVGHELKYEIGNQIATQAGSFVQERTDSTGKVIQEGISAPGLGNLGGIGLNLVRGAASAGNQLYSLGFGALIGLPPTTLSLLQRKGNSKLLYKTQVHALDNQQNNTKVGRSVPVRLGTNYGQGAYVGGGIPGAGVLTPGAGSIGGINTGLGGGLGYGGGLFDNIQYKDVGLVIDLTPKITNEGYVEVKMKLETSNVEQGADRFNPNFTQRSLQTTARVRDGVTSIVASVNQETRGDSRESIPVIGMLPLIGRLFTTPRETNDQSDLIITVTPHIIRATEITKEDNLARLAGTLQQGGQSSGLTPSVEDVLYRAQLEEEQERRLIAAQRGLQTEQSTTTTVAQTPAQTSPLTAPNAAPPVRNASNTDNGLPAGPSGTVNTFQPASNNNDGNQQNGRKTIVMTGDPNSPSPNANKTPEPIIEQEPLKADTSVPTELPPGANPSGANPNPPAGAEKVADLTEQPQQPQVEVKPAVVSGAVRPPHVEKYIQEEQLRLAKERANVKPQTAPARPVVEQVPLAQMVNAPAAMPKAAVKPATPAPATGSQASLGGVNNSGAPMPVRIEAPKAGTVALSLTASQPRLQVGRTVTVNVQVDAQTVLSSAHLSLRFDPAKLQLKSVRDGDMLGKQPDIMHTTENGALVFTINAPGGKAAKATGRLLVLEFIALAEGPVEISFIGEDTQVKLIGDVQANVNATPTQLSITR
jgi:general secretion pathway protein D